MTQHHSNANFMEWVRLLETGRGASMVVSKWYLSPEFKVYVRSTLISRAAIGVPVLALANIEVTQSHRGKGLFTGLIGDLRSDAHRLQAKWLTVDQVVAPRLGVLLERLSFEHYGDLEEHCYRFALAKP